MSAAPHSDFWKFRGGLSIAFGTPPMFLLCIIITSWVWWIRRHNAAVVQKYQGKDGCVHQTGAGKAVIVVTEVVSAAE
jgi:hypothetical protein